MKCKKCKREIPNKEHRTKRGCVFCDAMYHILKNAEDKSWEEYLRGWK